MNRRANLAALSAVLVLSGLAGETLRAHEGAGEQTRGPADSMPVVLQEFDGVRPNGKWEIHQYKGTFEYKVQPDALVMIDQKNRNQHLTRRGLRLDPKRPYAIETLFTIHERTSDQAPNSFCLNFNIAGPEGSLDSISCWSMNVDVAPGAKAGGVMKYMGFVEGRFRQIGQRKVPWASTNVEYLFRVEVNTDQKGQHELKTLTVTVMEGETERERFEVDYSSFPYQPDFSKPVRIGVNSHGADWTMRNLKVYAEKNPSPGR